MDAQQALADLAEISSQIEAAVLFDAKGDVAASTLADEARARQLAAAGAELLDGARGVTSDGSARLTQLEVSTGDGSVFLVEDGDRRILATTSVQPTIGLVFYDLKSCLRSLADEEEKPKAPAKPRRPRKKPEPKPKPEPEPEPEPGAS
jgi:predicted regulator of Ras-like GTPase activity (Roadblock/LC7/MglB family)